MDRVVPVSNDYTIKIEGYTTANPRIKGNDIWIDVMPEWISIKDKLPHKYTRVLVTDGNKVCLHYKQSMCNFDDERGYDLYCSCTLNHDRCDFVEGEITHWMPLPQPPME